MRRDEEPTVRSTHDADGVVKEVDVDVEVAPWTETLVCRCWPRRTPRRGFCPRRRMAPVYSAAHRRGTRMACGPRDTRSAEQDQAAVHRGRARAQVRERPSPGRGRDGAGAPWRRGPSIMTGARMASTSRLLAAAGANILVPASGAHGRRESCSRTTALGSEPGTGWSVARLLGVRWAVGRGPRSSPGWDRDPQPRCSTDRIGTPISRSSRSRRILA